MTGYYGNSNNGIKIFNINGQKYKSRYVSSIQYPGKLEYGYANIILNSGSCIHIPTKESFIEFLFKQDWLDPVEVL